MGKKVPRFYGKTLNERQLKFRYLRHIEQPGDRKFISSCYIPDGDFLNLRADLSEDDIKKLIELKKAINSNKKITVKLLPIFIIAAFILGIVFFFTIMANPLLRRATETGLEAIFEAKVDANGFRISLFRFEIALDSLTIADRDSPMQNLIEAAAMRIKLKPEAVLRGKVYIEEIRADSIRFGTPRSVSGALPERPPKEKPERPDFEIPPMIDLQNFDPMALLNSEFEKLLTPRLYDDAIESYNDAVERWRDEERQARERINEFQSRAEPLLAINVNDFRTLNVETIEQIRTIISDINAMMETVHSARDDVNRVIAGVETDINTARTLEQNARAAIDEDFNRLRSYLDPGSDTVAELLNSIVWSILTDEVYVYLEYGQRALEILEKVKEIQARLPKSSPKPENIFRGRDVHFATVQYPAFYLGTLATDFLTPSDWHWGVDLRGISSDPDLSGRPTNLSLSLAERGANLSRSGEIIAEADFRSIANERFNAEVTGAGFPVDLRAGLERIGIGGFSGGASFSVNASGNVGGGFSGGGSISLAQASLRNPANTFAQAADEAIRGVNSVDLGLNYLRMLDGRDEFSLNTNFGAILQEALTRIITQYIRQAEEALERALREMIERHIGGRFASSEELDLIFSALRGDRAAFDSLQASLTNKQAELENTLRAGLTDVTDQARQQVQDQARQALDELQQGRVPSTPSLPTITNPLNRR
ncbi:MAG: hypothetical protein FWG77_07545 [Treponema sp.]|nr:hypothetical protein [Treponema sp.]